MKKEMILAIVIGLTLGLLLTYGFYRARQAMTRPKNQLANLQATPTPSPVASTDLVIISPEDEVVQSDRTVQVTGTTKPNNFVIIFVNDSEQITQGDSSGNFSVKADLEVGSNIVIVHAIDEDGAMTTLERTVIVATVASDTATESASPSPGATAL